MPTPSVGALPGTGYIYPGVAVGFLYCTDSQVAIIDMFLANPDTDAFTRRRALDAITEHLLSAATILGAKYVKCDSSNPAIISRALKFGFKETGQHTSLFKELGNG